MKGRRGSALVEVLLALVILGSAAVSVTAHVSAVVAASQQVLEREAEMATAEQLLGAHTLLTRAELEIRIGSRPFGDFAVEVERPTPGLFRIGVLLRSTERELIATIVHRQEGGVRASP